MDLVIARIDALTSRRRGGRMGVRGTRATAGAFSRQDFIFDQERGIYTAVV